VARKKTGYIQRRGESFRIAYYSDGLRQFETFPSLAEAQRELAIRLAEIANGLPVSSRPNTVLFGELADDVLTDYEVNGYRSMDDIEARFRLHIIPVFGRRKACQITMAQIRKYTLMRQKAGAKPGTINRELEAIRHTFKFALKGRKLFHAPHVPMLREDNVRSGFFTREEVERLTSHLPAPLDSMVWFGFLTGWRKGDILGLEWRNVDFKRGEIRIDVGKDKSRKGRVFIMTVELRTLLANTRAAQNRTRIASVPGKQVPTLTSRVFPVGEFRKTWRTACYKAGIPCTVVPVKKGGKQGTVKVISTSRTFHDLRRSFVREMDILGVRHGAIKKLGGWKTDSVFTRYNIVSDSDLRDAIDIVDGQNRAKNGAKPGS
jgi:integrase